jgi:hypothetical protein
VRREVAPRKPVEPEGEVTRQPVRRPRKVTSQPENPKDKKNPKGKADNREKKPD